MKRTIPNLDGLRGIAILAVLAIHTTYGVIRGGTLGVDLFFVLSGFLITRLLLAELQKSGSIDFCVFYLKRAIRLGPPIIISLLLSAALWHVNRSPEANYFKAMGSILLFCSNFMDQRTLGNMVATWSLSVEEQFYFIWPIMLMATWLVFKNAGSINAVLSVIVISAISFRIWGYYNLADPGKLYSLTPARIDSIAIGAITAVLASTPNPVIRSQNRHLTIVIFVMVIFAIGLFTVEGRSIPMYFGGFTVFAILFAILIHSLCHLPSLSFFSNGPIVWIGRRSYGLYIYHYPIFFALEHFRVHKSFTNFLWVTTIRLATAFLFAALSYRFIERPILNLKSRIHRTPEQ